jgi:hypothetical protein
MRIYDSKKMLQGVPGVKRRPFNARPIGAKMASGAALSGPAPHATVLRLLAYSELSEYSEPLLGARSGTPRSPWLERRTWEAC